MYIRKSNGPNTEPKKKIEFVIFSNNINIDQVNILFNGENIKQVEYHTHLGVFLVTVNGVIILTTHAKGRPNEYTFYEN
jgi:hypothetical protein